MRIKDKEKPAYLLGYAYDSPSIPIVLLWRIRLLLHQDTIHTIQPRTTRV
jgi:hypothetical protein